MSGSLPSPMPGQTHPPSCVATSLPRTVNCGSRHGRTGPPSPPPRRRPIGGWRAGSVVGVATDRSTGFVAGLLGAWLAGCAFVPVDMQLPELRRLEMLDRVGASLLITPGARFDVGIQPDSRRIAQIDLEAP